MIYNFNKKILLVAITICLIVAFDQASKLYVINFFNNYFESNKIAILPFLNITLVWNKGISFGLFNQIAYANYLFASISVFITIILFVWLLKTKRLWVQIALPLVIGGAIGNVIDRLRYHAVTDFIELHLANYYWPSFNIADACISIGIAIVFIDNILEEVDRKKHA